MHPPQINTKTNENQTKMSDFGNIYFKVNTNLP